MHIYHGSGDGYDEYLVCKQQHGADQADPEVVTGIADDKYQETTQNTKDGATDPGK